MPATIAADSEAIVQAAAKLVEAVTLDDRAGGGLLSRETIRAVEELRIVLLRYRRSNLGIFEVASVNGGGS